MAPFIICPIVTIILLAAAAVGIYYGYQVLLSSSHNKVNINKQNSKPDLHPRRFPVKEVTEETVSHESEDDTSIREMPIVHIVTQTALNFTNANETCARSFTNGMLAFPKNIFEEQTLMATFINNYEKERPRLNLCEEQFYIGLRKVLDEEWLGANGELAAFGPPISLLKHNRHHDFADEHCSQILLSQEGTYYINNINCDSHVWNCFVCQHLCFKARPYCFSVHRDVRVRSYNEALQFCQFLKPESSLAVVPHVSVLKLITQQMELKRCKNAGIGHKFSGRYESPSGEKLSYDTKRIYYRPGGGKHITYNCIVINAGNNYKWEVESCSRPHCYVCFSTN